MLWLDPKEWFLNDAKKLMEVVRVWSGGEDGHILKDLEAYERTLKVKRKLYPHDLQSISKVDFVDGRRYVPAMVKAMLNAPTADSTGHANLFSNSDYTSLQPAAKARPFAKEANDLMGAATSFLNAYGRFDTNVQAKLLSDFEVRCVMHVHQKRCEIRSSYKSLQHIAKAMYDEAKAMDDKLPAWAKLKSIGDETRTIMPSGSLRKIRKDGWVADSEMSSRGFVVGAKILKKDDTTYMYTITDLGGSSKSITMQKDVEDEEPAQQEEPFEVDRFEVIASWAAHVVAQEVCFESGEYPDPLLYTDMLIDVWRGHIKSTLIDAFKKSSESKVVVHKEPSVKVVVGKSFKEEALHIVGLTNNITITNKHNTALCLGECFHAGKSLQGTMKAYARPHLQFPVATTANGFARLTVVPFIVAYWACPETLDPSKANCKATLVQASVKIGTVTHKIGIPTISNFKPLSEGDELVVLKVFAAEPEVQPDAKRHKSAPTSKGGKTGKGKGKGNASK